MAAVRCQESQRNTDGAASSAEAGCETLCWIKKNYKFSTGSQKNLNEELRFCCAILEFLFTFLKASC